ncbi:glycosyl transferase, family 2 [Fulvivirga imtechensis AK7]|uniref:Glycosyl transferase, family 2 n=1 Tax=Fulvivirga imtechensis AK7 TaxID=1237149 RepID=L8JTR1_9BACT|nr:glycosyltransferase family 2 protein [Fulvivirga imtechensis]ELR71633.1 glycosyl transferase, family 2 [Fulvivirga imtechensis AK7]
MTNQNIVQESQKPLVTIGIPTYNGGTSLKRAIHSALDQDYDHLEILVADNGSTDLTSEICSELVKLSPQIKYVRHPENLGMLANFEFLLQNASGDYFMWLAVDDTLARHTVSACVDFLEQNNNFVLASGVIEYTVNGQKAEFEHGFNFCNSSPVVRVMGYYLKVMHGAMYHGIMRTKVAQQVDIRRVIGNDWHFVANMAFLGKIRNLDFVGYHKTLGGASRDFRHYARLIGESSFAATHPHFKIAIDAYREVMSRSAVFSSLPVFTRFYLAAGAFIAVHLGYYVRIYPLVVGGRIKRGLKAAFSRVSDLFTIIMRTRL